MNYQDRVIKDFKHWTLYLSEKQCYLGETLIWAKRENALDFMEMTDEEKEELFVIGRIVKQALGKAFKPDLMNYSSLGNKDKHLHVHIIPRYESRRIFEDVTFTDDRWGHNYSPHNKDFAISDSVRTKIKDAIVSKI